MFPIWMLIAVYIAVTLLWWATRPHRQDGLEISPPVLMLVFAVFAAILSYSAVGVWGLIPAAVAMHSIHVTPNKWLKNTRSWLMSIRYALPAALSVAPCWFGVWTGHNYGLAYVAACLGAGIAYPVLQRYAPEAVADDATELLVGGAVIGGLILI